MTTSSTDRSSTDQAKRPRRADAVRTHERILEVASSVFTKHGANASLNEVAQLAGIGPGTLYRHFPTRQALLEALLRERFEILRDKARELLDAPDAAEALMTWLRAFIAHLTSYRDLSASIADTLCNPDSELFASCDDMRVSGMRLLARAKEVGAVDAEVGESDVIALANAIAWVTDRPSGRALSVDRLLALLGKGLWSR